MRITGLGHAGLLVETSSGTVLCDPWRSPAFFGSWFPFPDNTWLDWDAIGRTDYLYISHLHKDHFDPDLLRRHVRKDATVLLPDYPTHELESGIRDLGFTRLVRTRSGEPVELDGLRIMITALTGPGDGPVGDSALSLDDGETIILNQNDAHPLDTERLKRFGSYSAHFLQFSGALWWPMVYEFPTAAKRVFAQRKRAMQEERALRYIEGVGATHVFPFAGPPCLLDDELSELNGRGSGRMAEQSIFVDQHEFLRAYAEGGRDNGHLLLPGTQVELSGRACTVTQPHPEADIRAMFEDKETYLRDYARRRRPEIEREKASWVDVQPDLLARLKAWWEPLLCRAARIRAGVGGPVRLNVGSRALVVDFPHAEVREWNGEACRYQLSLPEELVATNVERREVDWQNSLFLSMRFSARRIGAYNEYLFTFFTCLSEDRIDYVEKWYAEQSDDGRDVVLDGWTVQQRCPHQRADLARFGHVEGTTLTCDMHGWRFDLETGTCLTSPDYPLRVSAHA
ncbi:Rieske 2Fe-2S domain-containing protein [Geodermatophilus sp. SYSU D00708]